MAKPNRPRDTELQALLGKTLGTAKYVHAKPPAAVAPDAAAPASPPPATSTQQPLTTAPAQPPVVAHSDAPLTPSAGAPPVASAEDPVAAPDVSAPAAESPASTTPATSVAAPAHSASSAQAPSTPAAAPTNGQHKRRGRPPKSASQPPAGTPPAAEAPPATPPGVQVVQLRLSAPRQLPAKLPGSSNPRGGRPPKAAWVRVDAKLPEDLVKRIRDMVDSPYRELLPDFVEARTMTSLLEMSAAMMLDLYDRCVEDLKKRQT